MTQQNAGNVLSWWLILLLMPFAGLLWVPWYNGIQPRFWGIPFFFWYQFLWVLLSAAITAVVYIKAEPRSMPPPPTASSPER